MTVIGASYHNSPKFERHSGSLRRYEARAIVTRQRINFLFLNLGHFFDHFFVLVFATIAALAQKRVPSALIPDSAAMLWL